MATEDKRTFAEQLADESAILPIPETDEDWNQLMEHIAHKFGGIYFQIHSDEGIRAQASNEIDALGDRCRNSKV